MDNQADRFVTKEKKDLIVTLTSNGASAISAVTTWQRAVRHFASGSAVET